MEATGKKKGRKAAATTGAVALALLLGLSGTFAWTSFSQRATNEAEGGVNPGGRLHDDFSFTADVKDKDIYVENFTTAENGAPIFARVQLKEYMETGKDAGKADASKADRHPIGGTSMTAKDSWETHMFDGSNTNAETFGKYFAWTTGGSKDYIPTFNMNRNCLAADIKGSLDDADGAYSKYADSKAASLTGVEIRDVPGSTAACDIVPGKVYECDGAHGDLYDETAGTGDYTETASAKHDAKATLNATETGSAGLTGLMSMAEWVEKGSKPGPYWVYDTDGWVYWAQAIEPGTATGLLLDKVDTTDQKLGDTWYYGIEAIGEFVSDGEWNKDGDACFFDLGKTKGITPDAYKLLENAANAQTLNGVTISVEKISGTAQVNSNDVQMKATVARNGTPIDVFDDQLEWSIEHGAEGTSISPDGKLNISAKEAVGNSIIVRASLGSGAVVGKATVRVDTAEPEAAWISRVKDAKTMKDVASTKTYATDSSVVINGKTYMKLAENDGKTAALLMDVSETNRIPIGFASQDDRVWNHTYAFNYLQNRYMRTIPSDLQSRIMGLDENFAVTSKGVSGDNGLITLPSRGDFYSNDEKYSDGNYVAAKPTGGTGDFIPVDDTSIELISKPLWLREYSAPSGSTIWYGTRIYMQLRHPNIAECHSTDNWADNPFTPMFWVDLS